MADYTVLLTGSGATSRANVEALMSDHYYANGEPKALVLSFTSKPSQGQVWAAQQAKQQKIDVIVYANTGAFLDSISHATMVETATPIDESIKAFKEAEVFILWSDEDPDCADALAVCKTYGLASYDLCDGLSKITPADEIKRSSTPVMPASEASTEKTPVVVEDEEDYEEPEDEEVEDADDEEEEYEDAVDDIYVAIDSFVNLIVDRLAKKLNALTEDMEQNK
jgi:hypothetical protein